MLAPSLEWFQAADASGDGRRSRASSEGESSASGWSDGSGREAREARVWDATRAGADDALEVLDVGGEGGGFAIVREFEEALDRRGPVEGRREGVRASRALRRDIAGANSDLGSARLAMVDCFGRRNFVGATRVAPRSGAPRGARAGESPH